jgi:hypothetical protein
MNGEMQNNDVPCAWIANKTWTVIPHWGGRHLSGHFDFSFEGMQH